MVLIENFAQLAKYFFSEKKYFNKVENMDDLPTEILFHIFSFLMEVDLIMGQGVNRRLRTICSDHRLTFYFRNHRTMPLPLIILRCCKLNLPISFIQSVKLYCEIENLKKYMISPNNLWGDCLIVAAENGSQQIMKKIISFGPSWGFREATSIAMQNRQYKCVNILRRECVSHEKNAVECRISLCLMELGLSKVPDGD